MRRRSVIFVVALAFAASLARPVVASALPAGVRAALAADQDVRNCEQFEKLSLDALIAKDLTVGTVRLTRGLTVYRVDAHGQCFCGNINCMTFAFADSKGDGSYREVVSATNEEATFEPDGTLVVEAHSSASTRGRSTYRFDGATYAAVKQEMVYLPTRAVKPLESPIRFAYGASSATVHSTVYGDFGDTFVFDAAKGQTAALSFALRSGSLGYVTVSQHGASTSLAEIHGTTWQGTLPASGRYEIVVVGSGEKPTSYAMTIAIH
jgi:hypothetical protein